MSTYTSKAFWVATAERAISTFAQAAVALLGGDQFGILDVDWGEVASVSALAAGLSVLKALAAAQVGTAGPSLTRSETLSPPAAQIDADDPRAQ